MGDSVLLGYEEEGDEVSSLPQDCRSISRNSGSISINSGSLSPTSGKLLVESGSLSRHSAKIYINSSTDTAKSTPDSRNSNHSSLSRNSSNVIITSDGTHTLPNYRSQSSLSRNSSNIIINSDSRNASSLSRHSSNIIINSDVTNSVADSNSVSRNSSNIIVNSTNLSRNSSNSTDLVSTSVDSRSLSPGSNKLSPDSSEVSPGNEDSSVDAVDGEAHQADSPRKSFLAPLPGDLSSLPRDLLPKRNPFVRGSDPRVATCRGKLQNKRCQLNQEINKELRLRAGAENLFKATHNRKLRETVALELSFVNSNLQLLKEQLASLNSSVELYQNDSKDSVMPMVPLGLKETKEVDFREPFTDFILEHYSEDAACYQDAISDFMDMRQAIRTPVRHASGVALLFRYYNQLYFIERRFFPPDRSLGIYFEWFDSLTGVPSCQRTVAFEKACILFNMAAIYTQIGAKQDRSESKGLDSAVDSLLRAAGMFRYIHENFTNAPSMDLGPDMLDMLVNLMLAQARECLFEKLVLGAQEECVARDKELCDDLPLCLDLCQESQTLAQQYQQLGQKMQAETVISYVPNSWVSLVNIKTEFYKALAHHHIATGLLNATSSRSPGSTRAQERISSLHGSETNLPDYSDYSTSSDRNVDGAPAKNGGAGVTLASREEQRLAMGKAHLAEALASYEEALRLQRMCRELKSKQSLCRVLRQHHEKAINQSALMPDIPDFSDVLETPEIIKSTKFQLSLTLPDFAQHRVEDLFKSLGPVAIFSAKRHWSAPRLVQLQKSQISTRTLRADRQQRELKRLERNRANGKPNLPQDTEGVYRNGQKVLRSNSQYEKRDRSEDNSSYYYQREIIKSDEKYKLQHEESTRFDYTTNGTRRRNSKNNKLPVTRQNGVYINGYNNSDKKIIKAYDPDTFVIKYNEKNSSTSDLRYNKDGSNRIRIKNDLLIGNGNQLNGKNAYFQKSMGAENFGYLVKQNGGQLVEMGNREATLLRRISSECNLTSADGDACDEDGHTKNSDGFGFSVRGDAPVIIASVEPRSLADLGGMREGDFIVAIGERDVKWCQHDEVVRLIKAAKDSLSLKLVTPMDRNYLTATPLEYGDGKMNLLNGSPNPPHPGSNQGSVSAASTASSTGSGGAGGRAHAGAKRAPSWNPFRRHHASRDSSSHRGSHSSNVIFR